jgi:excisionase family DNA binding protein
MDVILTLGELAEFLKARPTTIYRLLREKRIPAFRVGNEWRFHQDSVEQWMNEQETECAGSWLETPIAIRIPQPSRLAQGRMTKLRAVGADRSSRSTMNLLRVGKQKS